MLKRSVVLFSEFMHIRYWDSTGLTWMKINQRIIQILNFMICPGEMSSLAMWAYIYVQTGVQANLALLGCLGDEACLACLCLSRRLRNYGYIYMFKFEVRLVAFEIMVTCLSFEGTTFGNGLT